MKTKGKKNLELKDIRKDLPFEVPGDYFDRLNGSVMERIRQRESASPPVIKLKVVWIAAAAVIAGLIFVLPGILKEKTDRGLTHGEIALMLEEEIYDLDDYEMETSLSQASVVSENMGEEYEEEVIQYLLDENIELETIINEL